MNGVLSIPCPRCASPLRGHESRCPSCRKRLLPPDWVLPLVGFFVAGFFGLGLIASRDLKTMMEERATSPEEVVAVAQTFVERQAALQGPGRFTRLGEAEVERWRGQRWRVAGQAAMRDARGEPVRVLYSCVVARSGPQWALEEIRLETRR